MRLFSLSINIIDHPPEHIISLLTVTSLTTLIQARTYLEWLRWVILETLLERPHVFVNMDETTISHVCSSTQGYVPSKRVQRDQNMVRRRRKPDRHDVRTCLLGVVCNVPALQQFLPQVILPSYRKHIRPPAEVLSAYQNTGAPLEYWHDTNGWTSSATIKKWLTRLRSIVTSFDDKMWIVLIWDCAPMHLNEQVLSHARRLGILVLFVPAGLTHLLQVLDVYIYSSLKRRIREHMLGFQRRSHDGLLSRHGRILSVGKAIHESIVNVNGSDCFRSLGVCAQLDGLRSEVLDVMHHAPVSPALPDRARFAKMTGLASHTARTAHLHALTMQSWLNLRAQPVGDLPAAGARVPLRSCHFASMRHPLPHDGGPFSWDDVRMGRLRRLHESTGPPLASADQALNKHFRCA